MGDRADAWVGSAYLFVQSTSEKVLLPSLYGDPERKPQVFKALKLAFADSTGSLNGVDMLKVHRSDPHLIVQLKFCQQENCRKFLQSYRDKALEGSLQRHLRVSLAMPSLAPVQAELKTGAGNLDSMLLDEERCLECIYQEKPNHLRDEEISKLEECFKNLSCHQKDHSSIMSPVTDSPSPNSSFPPDGSVKSLGSVPQGDTFTFQGQQFGGARETIFLACKCLEEFWGIFHTLWEGNTSQPENHPRRPSEVCQTRIQEVEASGPVPADKLPGSSGPHHRQLSHGVRAGRPLRASLPAAPQVYRLGGQESHHTQTDRRPGGKWPHQLSRGAARNQP